MRLLRRARPPLRAPGAGVFAGLLVPIEHAVPALLGPSGRTPIRPPPTTHAGAFALAQPTLRAATETLRRARSRDAPSRSLVPLEMRKLIAMATTIGAAGGPASRDYGRDPRSRLPARTSTAGERRGDVMQRANERTSSSRERPSNQGHEGSSEPGPHGRSTMPGEASPAS
jgi:hypothetical protein